MNEEHKKKWATGIGADTIDTTNDADTKNTKLVTGKAVTDYVKSQKLTFKTDFGSQEKALGETIDIIGGETENKEWEYKKDQTQAKGIDYSNKNVMTKVDGGKVLIGLKKNVEFDSLKIKDKSSITQVDNSLDLTYDGAKLSIAKDNNKIKLSGLKDNDINSDDYGKHDSVIVATQKEVKDALNQTKKIQDGSSGTVVYTKKAGTRLVKEVENGQTKWYIAD